MPHTSNQTWAALALVAAGAMVLLTGCNGGAQNIDPVGKVPGASHDAGRDNAVSCTVVADTALQKLTESSTKGKVAVAYGVKTSNGWYLAGPIGDNTSFSSTIGLWATPGNIQSDNFSSRFYSLNKDAQSSTGFATSAPSPFAATATAAKKALACAKAAKS